MQVGAQKDSVARTTYGLTLVDGQTDSEILFSITWAEWDGSFQFLTNSNSNWTFIVLKLPKQEDSKAQQNKKADIKISVSKGIAGVKHHGERQGNDAS